MAFILYTEGCYCDTHCGVIEHPDAAEALGVLAMLEPYDGPEAVAVAQSVVLCDGYQATSLASIVGGYLHRPPRQELVERLPIGILRAAVEDAASQHEQIAAASQHDNIRAAQAGYASSLREALFLREQRDRIAADLADMERFAAMASSSV